MTQRIGVYNVTTYFDPIWHEPRPYYLITVDKFSKENKFIWHKHFYFASSPTNCEFTERSLDDLWNYPSGTKIAGQHLVWDVL